MSSPLKVLHLEDSQVDAELVSRVLKKTYSPCEVKLVMIEEDFIEALDDFGPDIILADNSLPLFSASEALQIVQQRNLIIPFIMVTGTVSEEYAVNIIKNGADDYILKDRLTRLPAAIDASLRQHQLEAERANALKQLIESEEKYRTLVERISDGFLVMNNEWKIVYINKAAELLLQKPVGSLLNKRLDEEFPAGIGGPIFKTLNEAKETGVNKYMEEYSSVMGKWIYGSVYPSADGLAVFFRDITEQRMAQEEIRKMDEKYKTFIQRITDAFISLDREWKYTYLNKQAGELVHRNPDDLLGKNVWDIFPEAIGSDTYKAFHKALEEQHYISNTDYFEPLDLWQENHIYPSEDGLSVFIRDISERKKLEMELQEQQRMEQLNLTAAALIAREKERNSIGIELHDNVNQLLVGTKMMLGLIKENPSRASELITSCIDNIREAVNENRKIAHELVAPDLTTETLIQQITRLFQTMLHPSGLDTLLQHDSFSEDLLNDDMKLAVYRIIQEQFTNIIKYADASLVVISLSTTGKIFSMRIADDGKGMEPVNSYEGIGLRNIYSRLSVLGGEMKIDTEPDKGFAIEIEVPVS